MKQSDLTIVPSEWNEQYGRVIQGQQPVDQLLLDPELGQFLKLLLMKNSCLNPKSVFVKKKN